MSHRNPVQGKKIMMLIGVVTFAIAPVTLQAYMPTRWSPLDVYVLRGKRGGPRVVRLLSKGKVLQSAKLSYSSSGLLLRETYDGTSPRRRGTTSYSYSAGRLVAERVHDGSGRLRSVKRFVYSRGQLSGLVVFDAARRVVMRQKYTLRDKRIVEGRETNGQAEKFAIRYRGKRPVLIRIARDDGKTIGQITYTYDLRGRLKLRLREANGLRQKCVYERDAKGRIVRGKYYELRGRRWIQTRTLQFEY